MADLVMASFADQDDANKAIAELNSAGYNAEEMSVMMKSPGEGKPIAGNPNVILKEGIVARAKRVGATGGVIGGLAGLLLGIVALTIPGLGGLLFVGPLAAALGLSGATATTFTGAFAGVVAGGLLGVFESFGVPKEAAQTYAESIKQGGVVLAVPVKTPMADQESEEILSKHNAQQLHVVSV